MGLIFLRVLFLVIGIWWIYMTFFHTGPEPKWIQKLTGDDEKPSKNNGVDEPDATGERNDCYV